ncbi:MAG: hypothetical protein U0324_25955 [Polyangiales bacterium]
MAERTYTPTDLVALPRLSAREALALGRALLAVAQRTAGLPNAIREATADLDGAVVALAAAVPAKRKAAPVLREADRVEDNAVAAIVALLKAWVRLPEGDFPREVGVAARCLDVFLEGGTLDFLTFRPVVEHSEVQRRIENLQAQGLDRELRKLGAGPFVDHLLAAHAAYGAACGITGAAAKAESPALRAATLEVTDSLRAYVVAVVASVSRKKPETAGRADELLRPLSEWVSAGPSGAAEEEGDGEEKDGAAHDAVTKSIPADAPANDAEARRKVG